jgi:polyribonucleotide nucleotidyltransferase
MCNAQIDFISDYKEQFGIPEIEATFNNPDTSLYELVKGFMSEDKMEALYEKGKKEFQKELDKLDVEVTEFLEEKGHIKNDKTEENEDIVTIDKSEV